MKTIEKSTVLSASREILNKIKKLKVDTISPIVQIAGNSDKNRVYLSRLADMGEIVKVKRGQFYKPSNKTLYKESNRTVKLDKSIFVNDLFWSVKDGFEINAADLIKAYLLHYTEEDLMGLYTLFGYKRLLRESLKIYKKRTDENYKKIRTILERFEEWRLNDIPDKNAAAFRINSGDDLENYHLKFMVDGIKLEFSHFRSPIQKAILDNAAFQRYDEHSSLKILSLNDIIALKIIALFNRQKTRDLFDASIILEKNLLDIAELERIYSYVREGNNTIQDYIATFRAVDDDGDNSLDFLAEHEYYKAFAKKSQTERFIHAKEMFLQQYDQKQSGMLSSLKRTAVKNKKGR